MKLLFMLIIRNIMLVMWFLQVLVNEEVGFWLARILYTHNPAKSDSVKIAGIMELFRVQVFQHLPPSQFCVI